MEERGVCWTYLMRCYLRRKKWRDVGQVLHDGKRLLGSRLLEERTRIRPFLIFVS